tara:strand:- start:30383 stop:32269 length:1887 start_codon:yes stop_codon:yes gene_type:complete
MASRITQKLSVSELDFDNIKTALKTYLGSQGEFTDYDFEGSSMAVLLDILAYNTHYNSFYANMIANEMFLDSAGARSSVVSRSKHLGYLPRSARGSIATVAVNITVPLADAPTTILIPKGHTFTTTFEGVSYSYITTEAHTVNEDTSAISPGNKIYSSPQVVIKEGIAASYQYAVGGNLDSQKFTIPNDDVDTSSISVVVYDTTAGTTRTSYNLYEDYTALDSESEVFFLQEIADNKYEIYFGDGVIGSKPQEGNIVEINYNIVKGFDSSKTEYILNGQSVFSADPIPNPDQSSSSFSDVSVGLVNAAGGGVLPETLESIKYLAPLNYQAQSRAVTKSDYKTRLLTDYPNLDAVGVWGGEEVTPPDYGTVYISLKPASGYIISDSEKDRIANDILKTRNLVTIRPKFVDPQYIYITADVNVKYDSRVSVRTGPTLSKMARLAITDFSNQNLNDFGAYFKHSFLTRTIDALDPAITNCLLSVSMQKDLLPTLSVENNYSLDFANPIHHPHSGHMGAIASTLFNYSVYENCALFDEDGVLKIYYTNPAGGMTIVSESVGTVDYDTGKVELTAFAPNSYAGSALVLTAKPRRDDIISTTNTLLTIRESGVLVTMTDDSSSISGTVSTIASY